MKMPFLWSLSWVTVTLGFVSFAGYSIRAAVSRPAALAGASSNPATKIVYAHYMHSYVYGYLTADKKMDEALQGANDLDHWPPEDEVYREGWARDLAPNARGGDSALQKDFDLGQRAGLNAFGLLLNRGGLESAFAPGLNAMFRLAEKNPVKILIEIWDDVPKSKTAEENAQELMKFGSDVKQVMDRYPDSYVRIQGKPVVVLARLTGENCQTLLPFFNAWDGPQNLFLIAYDPLHSQKKNLGAIINSPRNHGLYGAGGCPISGISDWDAASSYSDSSNTALPVIAKAKDLTLDWPINLPYTEVRPGPNWVSESLGASRFIDQWRNAISYNASLVDLQTWNDFTETILTDTNLQGLSFIDLNRYFSDWYHSGSAPVPTQDKLWLFYHHQLVNADISGHRSSDPQLRNETPLTDYVEVVSLLTAPGNLEVQNNGAHYSLKAPAGFHDWILYTGPSADRVAKVSSFHAEAQTKPLPGSYPVSNSFRTAQQIPAVSPGVPVVTLTRTGPTSLKLVGRTAIQGKAAFEDLEVVGSEITAP